MKKYILHILLILTCMLPANAQLATGSWKQYPVFGEFSDLIDTGKGLWYVTGGCLYHYDKDADETRFYEGGSELSDFTVKFARYYPEKDMLAVAYANSNIDMILADGSRVNLPDIKDAIVNVDKAVNDVVFCGDEMYVATGFGVVIYDLNRLEVKESGIYHRDIRTVIVTPGYLYVCPSAHDDWKHSLYSIERGRAINNFDNFRLVTGYYDIINQAEPLNEERTLFATIRYNVPATFLVNEDGSVTMYDNINRNMKLSRLSRSADGTVRFITNDGQIAHFVDRTSIAIDKTLPSELKGNLFAADKDLTSAWLAGEDGIGNYDLSAADGSVTVLRDKSVPSGAITFNEVCNIFPSNDPTKFYIANLGMTQHHPVGDGDRFNVKLKLNIMSRDDITDINPSDVPAYSSPIVNQQNINGKYIYSPTQVAEDPDYSERVFIGCGGEGVYVVENGDFATKFDGNNAPINKNGNYYWGTVCVSIDQEGNLWVGSRGDKEEITLVMLPASKRNKKDLSTLTYNDWIIADYENFLLNKDIKLLHCSKSNMIFGIDGAVHRGFLAVNHNGTRSDISDDRSTVIMPVDQDGKTFDPLQYVCMAEDKRGHVWMGTTSGAISITNPAKALDADFRINRIKVPRNDGSGLADYLLESDKIVAIAVDNSNRKWLGTEASGLYLVSEDGDKIISHFTADNSPLPSNTITALYADPMSNSIFIGTLAGLYEYSSTSGPSKPDYSDVYAYPNPVTPDYSGWITIAGLMDSSLVKIMDSSMHLVYQTVSEGGTAIWDGCTTAGERVRSGVYYVLASSQQGDASSIDSSSTGDVVAKILVVN